VELDMRGRIRRLDRFLLGAGGDGTMWPGQRLYDQLRANEWSLQRWDGLSHNWQRALDVDLFIGWRCGFLRSVPAQQ
jgi:hypothetical protein